MWVHPVSRALVDRLVRTSVTPNQISVSSVFAAAAAGLSFVVLPPILGPVVGLAALFVWHVLDGADGDLARRTGRATAAGELIDGVCDHTSQVLIYISLGIVLQRALGAWAWPVTVTAGLSHAVQANAYEAGRKTYRHWVYGADWMRQRPDSSRSLTGLANWIYLGGASFFSPNEALVEAAMERWSTPEAKDRARAIYRRMEVCGVKRSGLLGATGRSLAMAASLLAGSPLWFFLYEIVFLNAALLVLIEWRGRTNLKVSEALGSLGAEL